MTIPIVVIVWKNNQINFKTHLR